MKVYDNAADIPALNYGICLTKF